MLSLFDFHGGYSPTFLLATIIFGSVFSLFPTTTLHSTTIIGAMLCLVATVVVHVCLLSRLERRNSANLSGDTGTDNLDLPSYSTTTQYLNVVRSMINVTKVPTMYPPGPNHFFNMDEWDRARSAMVPIVISMINLEELDNVGICRFSFEQWHRIFVSDEGPRIFSKVLKVDFFYENFPFSLWREIVAACPRLQSLVLGEIQCGQHDADIVMRTILFTFASCPRWVSIKLLLAGITGEQLTILRAQLTEIPTIHFFTLRRDINNNSVDLTIRSKRKNLYKYH